MRRPLTLLAAARRPAECAPRQDRVPRPLSGTVARRTLVRRPPFYPTRRQSGTQDTLSGEAGADHPRLVPTGSRGPRRAPRPALGALGARRTRPARRRPVRARPSSDASCGGDPDAAAQVPGAASPPSSEERVSEREVRHRVARPPGTAARRRPPRGPKPGSRRQRRPRRASPGRATVLRRGERHLAGGSTPDRPSASASKRGPVQPPRRPDPPRRTPRSRAP